MAACVTSDPAPAPPAMLAGVIVLAALSLLVATDGLSD
jgi:hypothetical protein